MVDGLALWTLNFRIKRLAAYRLNARDTEAYKHREEGGPANSRSALRYLEARRKGCSFPRDYL